MKHEYRSLRIGMAAMGFGLVAAAIYLLMIIVTLARIETVSGLVPFDMRPFGYGPADASALLDALGPDGRAYYLSRQIPLDTLYPAMLALTLIAMIRWFGRSAPHSGFVRLGIMLSVGAALFDYAENIGIVAMILSWPDPPVPLVLAASTASILKSALTTLAVVFALLVGFASMRPSNADLRSR